VGVGAVVVSVDSATQITVSIANAGTVSGTCTFFNGPGRIRSWEVKIENSLAERFYLGAANTDLPLPESRTQISWTFEEEYQDDKAFQAARLFTDTAPKIIFRDPTAVGSAAFREFELRSNKARCKFENPVNKYGKILCTTTHRAY